MKIEATAITHANAAALLDEGRRALERGDGDVDLSAVARCDSSAVALLVALRREAQSRGTTVRFSAVPPSLLSLARLYRVDAMIA